MTEPTLIVSEMFYSIQGESLFAGCPCVFVRLSGCNLRCAYCDTTYAFHEGTELAIDAILEKILTWPCKLVEITGGEPLYQKNTPELVRRLLDLGLTVLVETNGSYPIHTLDRRCVRIVDVKCPSSTESHRNLDTNFSCLDSKDQIKFVMMSREDYRFAKDFIENHRFPFEPGNILFAPVTDSLDPATLAKWILEDGLAVRLQLQLHKTLWPDVDRGV